MSGALIDYLEDGYGTSGNPGGCRVAWRNRYRMATLPRGRYFKGNGRENGRGLYRGRRRALAESCNDGTSKIRAALRCRSRKRTSPRSGGGCSIPSRTPSFSATCRRAKLDVEDDLKTKGRPPVSTENPKVARLSCLRLSALDDNAGVGFQLQRGTGNRDPRPPVSRRRAARSARVAG